MPPHQGRLELTWTNKHLRLLAHEDGAYEWVPPEDYRVAEVRLLHDRGTVGDTVPAKLRAQDNLLIRGDALNALIDLPEFARQAKLACKELESIDVQAKRQAARRRPHDQPVPPWSTHLQC